MSAHDDSRQNPNERNPMINARGAFGPSPATPQMWECANRHCMAAARTVDTKTPFHPCPEMGGAMIPLVHTGQRVEHRLIERGDYVGAELVQPIVDRRGRLIMSVETHRDDGFSTTIFAPTAQADATDVREAKETADG